MKNLQTSGCLLILLASLLVTEAYTKDIRQIEKWGDNLLKPVQVEDEKNILAGRESHLLGIEDVRYVEHFINCTVQINAVLENWKKRLNIVARRQEVNTSGVMVEVNTRQPIKGSIFVIYRFIRKKNLAYLKFLFDSNQRINPGQQEQIVHRFKMLDLKQTLSRAMECSQT